MKQLLIIIIFFFASNFAYGINCLDAFQAQATEAYRTYYYEREECRELSGPFSYSALCDQEAIQEWRNNIGIAANGYDGCCDNPSNTGCP